MGIGKISLGVAASALLGTTPLMAAPVTPSTANLSLNSAVGARLGATKSAKSSNVTGGAAVIGVLAIAAVAGGVVAATSNGHSKVSP